MTLPIRKILIAAENLNPQKARVLLMLSLTQTRDPKQIQQYFQQF